MYVRQFIYFDWIVYWSSVISSDVWCPISVFELLPLFIHSCCNSSCLLTLLCDWQTKYSGCWMLQHLSVACTSMTVSWFSFCVLTCIGSMWIWYKLGVTVYWCLHNKVPQYLADCCIVSDIASHQRLHSHHVDIPCYQHGTLGCWAFSVAGLTTWNLLTDELKDPSCADITLWQSLKIFLFTLYLCVRRIRGVHDYML